MGKAEFSMPRHYDTAFLPHMFLFEEKYSKIKWLIEEGHYDMECVIMT